MSSEERKPAISEENVLSDNMAKLYNSKHT